MTTTNKQDKLRSHFFDNAETVFILLDKELRLIDANEIFFRVQSFNRENIIGKYISDISPDIKSNGRLDLYKKVLKTGKTLLVDEIKVRQSSESFYARIKVFKVGDGLGIIAKDISDLKRTIENHRLLEEKYKTIIETTDEMIHQISAEGKIVWANLAWKKYMEVDDEDFIGKNLIDFIDDKTKKEFAEILPLILKGKRVDNLSCTFISKNGKLLFLEGQTLPIFNNGKITGSQAFLRNVTERKIAEQKIIEANKRFTHAARASKEIIYDFDIHNNTIWWNENYYELLGLDYEDKFLDIGSWTKFIHPDDHDRVVKSLTDFLEGKENYWFGEYRFLGKKKRCSLFC